MHDAIGQNCLGERGSSLGCAYYVEMGNILLLLYGPFESSLWQNLSIGLSSVWVTPEWCNSSLCYTLQDNLNPVIVSKTVLSQGISLNLIYC